MKLLAKCKAKNSQLFVQREITKLLEMEYVCAEIKCNYLCRYQDDKDKKADISN